MNKNYNLADVILYSLLTFVATTGIYLVIHSLVCYNEKVRMKNKITFYEDKLLNSQDYINKMREIHKLEQEIEKLK